MGQLLSGLDTLNWISLLISAASVAVLLFGRRLNRAAPWALVVLVLATLAVVGGGLADRGVAVLGPVQAGPPQLTVPHPTLTQWLSLVLSALALTMVTMAEGLLVSRSYGAKNGYRTEPDRDLAAFRHRQHRLRADRRLRRGVLHVQDGGHGPGRLAHAAAQHRRRSVGTAAARVRHGRALGHPLTGDRGRRRGRRLPPARHPRAQGSVGPGRLRVRRGRNLLPGALLLGPIPGIFVAFVLALVNLARRPASPAVDVLSADADADHALTPLPPGTTTTVSGVIVMRFAAPA